MGLAIAQIQRRVDRAQRSLCGIFVALALMTMLARLALPREPAEEFVKGLQDRGLHELALDYLEQLKTSPLADDATRRQVPYLRGTALIEQSRQSADATARNRLLDEARKELQHFAEANPHSVEGAEAEMQLALVQMSLGQEQVTQIGQLPKEKAYDARRKTLGREARKMLAEARDTFARAEQIYSSELEKLPPTTNTDPHNKTATQRQEYRARSAQIRFMLAQIQFDEAQSYPPDAEEFQKLNETAAQELSSIYEEFARSIPYVGLSARLFEGRCYQALGKYTEALGSFDEVINSENSVALFRKLTASAIQRKAEVLMAQGKLDAALIAIRSCLKDTHRDEVTQPEWLGVRFRFAEALSRKAEAATNDSAEQRRLRNEAREAYRTVAKTPGEYQAPARLAVATVHTGAKSDDKSKEEPRNFKAAYELGKDALSSYTTAQTALPSAEKNNPDAVPELKAQMERGKEDARRYFRLATTLVDDDTDPKMLNEVRYFLCWLYWESKDYFRAAVLGEFIARRYPDHPAASPAAKLAMASFEQLYGRAVSANGHRDKGTFESKRMAEIAELITRRWPKSEDADAAYAVLVNYAVTNGRIDEAEKLLGEAPTQARPRLELRIGNAMWERYWDLNQPGATQQSNETERNKIKAAALKYLRSGFDALRNETPVSSTMATAALWLSQALLNESKYAEAIAVLEDSKVGPLTLIAGEDPNASRAEYAVEAYKAALRAYVSVTPPQEKKAIATMKSLERLIKAGGDTAKSSEELNRTYIGMGMLLQKQIEDLRANGQEEEATRVAGSIAKFLDRISVQQGTANWPTRVWLAQTYYAMASDRQKSLPSGTETSTAPLTASARTYFTKARDTYQQLLKEAAENPKLPPSENAVLAAKIKLGECYHALGQYSLALDTFFDVLKEKETTLEVQRSAALAYQERGEREDPKFFESAIRGGYKSPKTNKNVVWGWLKISQAVTRGARTNEKFRDAFYESWFNIARCRYMAGMKKLGDARREDLTKAKDNIQTLSLSYPDMGGEKWKPQFEQLKKLIEAAMKEEG
jgi:cellulose synthase operon protein C